MDFNYDQALIEQFRNLIYRYVCEHSSELDLADVQNRIALPKDSAAIKNVKIADWMLKRLLHSAKQPGNIDSGLEKFVEIFQYRKQYQVRLMTEINCCPAEFYRIKPVVIDGTDVDGNRLFIIRIRYYQKLTQLDTIIKHYLLYQMEHQDQLFEQGDHKGLTLVIDCQEFSYRHLNLDMVNFIIQMAFKYPALTRKMLIFELAWAFTYLFKLVERIVDAQLGTKEKLIHMVNSSNLDAFIVAEKRPEFILNGPKKLNREVPKEVLPFAQVVKQNLFKDLIEERNAVKIDQYLQSLL